MCMTAACACHACLTCLTAVCDCLRDCRISLPTAGLRAGEEQLWLSRLSQAPAVRLVASVDHVNAALLWNSRVAAAFNWLWVDGTTYAGYEAETAHVAPIITSKYRRQDDGGTIAAVGIEIASSRAPNLWACAVASFCQVCILS